MGLLRRFDRNFILFPGAVFIIFKNDRELERVVLLKVIDRKWMDHIDDMEQLRQGVGLQAYGQRDQMCIRDR